MAGSTYNREYYQTNKEILKARSRTFYANHREERKAKLKISRRLKLYGLSEEAYSKMFAEQEGKCAIASCRKSFDDSQFKTRPVVDHDHKTGVVRGLLCGPCNRALGFFERPDFESMLTYLQIHRGN